MRSAAGSFALLVAAAAAAKATLVVVIPAKQSTVVCTDRRIVGSRGTQFDSDDKLQLLTPRALFFVTGLEGISAKGNLLYAPEAEFRKFLAARADKGIPPDQAVRNSEDVAEYLRASFEQFLKDYRFPPPASLPVAIEPAFMLGILRAENHTPHLTTITVSRDAKKPAAAISHVSYRMERFGTDNEWPGSIFSRSDPMYAGETQVIQGLINHYPKFAEFAGDPYVKRFLLADFGMRLTDPESALNAARRLIAVTAEGLPMLPLAVPGVSRESVCAVLDYGTERAEYR